MPVIDLAVPRPPEVHVARALRPAVQDAAEVGLAEQPSACVRGSPPAAASSSPAFTPALAAGLPGSTDFTRSPSSRSTASPTFSGSGQIRRSRSLSNVLASTAGWRMISATWWQWMQAAC